MDNSAQNPKDQITDRLKQATNVLVTVSANPSVDQLAGAIGLTLLLNKLGKHAIAVFSGQIPSTLEFLQPEKTLESNTDSLRDFIIALDKSKADKLRYKVEDQMVKIFITPYRTSISDKDLEFSQGDFNVDVVIGLGVKQQQDLDQAITAHGRILHDATVVSIGTQDGSSLGSINWVDTGASSLSEMLLDLGLALKADVLDGQMATAFLTGIVAETNRFSNEKTSAETMQLSAKLMAAGANQQLIASQLQAPNVSSPPNDNDEVDAELPEVADSPEAAPPVEPQDSSGSNGSLEIDHGEKKPPADSESESEDAEPAEERLEQIDIDTNGTLKTAEELEEAKQKAVQALPDPPSTANPADSRIILQPPSLGSTLSANSSAEGLDQSTDPLNVSAAAGGSMLSHEPPSSLSPFDTPPPITPQPATNYIVGATPTAASLPPQPPAPSPSVDLGESPNTLADLEKVVDSPHLDQSPSTTQDQPAEDVNAARDAVLQAVSGATPQVIEPVQSLNAQPADLNLGDMPAVSTSPASSFINNPMINPTLPVAEPSSGVVTSDPGLPPGLVPPDPGLPSDNTDTVIVNPSAPPPVPPPLMPPVMPPAEDPNSPNNAAL